MCCYFALELTAFNHINTVENDLIVAKKLLQLKQSADSRNIEFDLSFVTIKKLLNAKRCYYTGEPFEENGDNSRSIDRVDPNRGYVEGNVVACTVNINQKKANLTCEEIHQISRKLKEHQRNKR